MIIALLILVRYRDCHFEAGGRRQEEVHLIILKKAVNGHAWSSSPLNSTKIHPLVSQIDLKMDSNC
jgi:hypothetical protein